MGVAGWLEDGFECRLPLLAIEGAPMQLPQQTRSTCPLLVGALVLTCCTVLATTHILPLTAPLLPKRIAEQAAV